MNTTTGSKTQELWSSLTSDEKREAEGFNENAETVSSGSFLVPANGARGEILLHYRLFHQILRTYWSNEFRYEVTVWEQAQGGPLLTVDKIDMHITREIDHCDAHVVREKTSTAFDSVKFQGGPTGRSCVQAEIWMWGYIFRTPMACQSANRAGMAAGLRKN